MGLLSQGTPLQWEEVAKYVDHVRYHGIVQLLHTIEKYRSRSGDKHLWGDETEYMVIKREDGRAVLSLRQEEILGALMSTSRPDMTRDSDSVLFHQEYGRFMVEATPLRPYSDQLTSLLDVEANMQERREIAKRYLDTNEALYSITSYPRLGVGHFAETETPLEGEATKSLFLPDDVINLHPRFPTLSCNIRKRRGKKVEIAVPVFKDTKTVFPWVDPLTSQVPASIPSNHIYMDAMGFGMGCCCLQLTLQGSDMDEARDLYDALAPLAPVLLALSAASPIFRGVLADQDIRWNVVSASVDDRMDEEKKRIPKSRYDSVDCYISRTNPIIHGDPGFYNDIHVPVNPKVVDQLEAAGFANDPLLVQHFAHLFIRDPLVVFEELVDQNDAESTDHFENIQSTNWQTIRFKPPPDGRIGWRTEFRPMEIQFTDFENAAYSVFLILISRAILALKLTFYQPLSQVDANMRTAHRRDPIGSEKFWFRLGVEHQTSESKPEFAHLSLDEIFNGTTHGTKFVGLIPLVRKYLASTDLDESSRRQLERYLTLISQRASGELISNAAWIRNFVQRHPDYKHDSIISEKVNHDLLAAIEEIAKGNEWPELQKLSK